MKGFLESWKYLVFALAMVNIVVVDVALFKVIRDRRYVIREEGGGETGLSLMGGLVDDEESRPPMALPSGALDSCGSVCQQTIAQEIAVAMATVSGERVVETRTIVKEVASADSGDQANIVYVPIVTTATSTDTDWASVIPSEFYFDLNSYPGAKTVRFTGYLRAVHATGPVYIRLYDDSNNRGVDNSDFSTSDNSSQRFESAPISIWQGNNLYKVQLRSPTATQARLSEVKLKVEW